MPIKSSISRTELQAPFAGELGKDFPVVLSPKQLAELLGLSVKTIYGWMAVGRLDGCYTKRGKHNLIWRDKALDRIFNGPEWQNVN
jgi:excisionase family DNA binding protein